jgi:multidrug efflux pump subunit AcrA (membrane-fusion protein)
VGKVKRLIMPAAAVLRRGGMTAVYMLDTQGVPRLRQVRLGEPAGDGAVEVLAGLAEGDKVVLDPVKAGIADAK